MTPRVGKLAIVLDLDPRSRRALEETLRDRDAEAAVATGTGRVWVHVRWCVAMGRVLLGSAWREGRTMPVGSVSVRLAFGVLLPALLWNGLPYFGWTRGVPPNELFAAMLFLLPGKLLVLLSIGTFVAFSVRPATKPAVLPVAVVVFAITVLCAAALSPADEAFRQLMYAASTAGRPDAPPLAPAHSSGWLQAGRLGWAFSAACAALLAGHVRRLSRWPRWLAVAATLPTLVVVTSMALAMSSLAGIDRRVASALIPWALATVVIGLLVWLGARPDRQVSDAALASPAPHP